MEFRILGPLDVIEGDRVVDTAGAKHRALLAMLLLHPNQVVSLERLIDALWEDEPPETAQKALQVYVSQLRKALGKDRVQTQAPGYRLRVEEDELDLARFQRLVEDGRLKEALAVWRGPPLAEFASERFAQSEIARLEELRLACLEQRIDHDLGSGRHAEVVGELEALVAEHPLRERVRAQLMLALYRSGRQAEALAAYQSGRHTLVEELGIEPGRPLRELERAILEQDPSLDFVSAGKGASEATAESRGAFVGRAAELEELLGGLDAVVAGRGRLFLLSGEPGIGKSRLADELRRAAQTRGFRVLTGRCWEAGGAPAYWPWVQSLRAYVRETGPELLRIQLGAGAAELAQILPELREILPGLPEPAASDSEGARFRLFDATAEFLRNASTDRPIVLILDDLHAADTPSLMLLQFLARELGPTHLLVLGAFRDVDPIPGPPLTAMLAEVVREPVTRRLPLTGLSQRDVIEYVQLTASAIVSAELAAALHEGTEGNPLFVGETVRLLSLEGVQPDSTGNVQLAIPQNVRDVIARRLAHLSEECNRLLLLASVLGREFVLDALARVGGVSDDELLETLDEAMAARVVSEVPGGPGRLRFAHVLIRDTLYDGLTTARRVRWHRLTVEALEALYGDQPGTHLAELAHHSVAGSDFNKGLEYARRGGERAFTLLAYEEAARLYEMALDAFELADLRDEGMRCELLISLGEAELRAGESLTAKRAFLKAADIARRLGLPHALGRAATGYGGRIMYARAGDDDHLVPLLEEGVAGLDDQDVELRTRLLARLAGALRDEPGRDRRDRLSLEAVALARGTGNPTALAYALDGRAAAIMAPDTVAECFALGSELREVAEQIGDRERMFYGNWHRIIVQMMTGDILAAEANLEAVSLLAEELRQPVQLWQVYSAQAMLALAKGRLPLAEELVTEAFSLGQRAQPEMAIPVHRLQRYALCDFQGSLEEIEPEIRELADAYPARPVFRCALAHLHARVGRTAEAMDALDDLAQDGFSTLPFDMEWLYAMSLLVETSALLDDTDSASVMYGLLLPWESFNVTDHPEGFRGAVARYLGILATTTGRWHEAGMHFEVALEMNERMGVRPWLARTQHDYARMLRLSGTRNEEVKAQFLLSQALATYQDLGMHNQAAAATTRTVPAGTPTP
jgi:DNA-binding SARP family transcriptional activator/tetratricopeptide (TPR) repeat protein